MRGPDEDSWPAGRQLGALWGAVAAALLGLAPAAQRLAEALPPCPIRGLTGLPCPTCGTVRAAQALAGLEPLQSLAVNPLASLAWMALVGGGILAGTLAALGRSLREPDWQVSRPVRWSLVALLLVNWIYLIGTGT